MAIYSDSTGPAPRRQESNLRSVRARAIGFMFVALAAGVGCAWMVTRYLSRHAGSAVVVPTGHVVVAAVDIPVAGNLTPEVLKVVDWPLSAQPQGSFDAIDAVNGRVANVSLVAGEPIVESRLSPKGAGAGMASLIPPSMRAMTVTANDVIGVSGFIHPGDVVDVITTMSGPVPGAAAGTQDQFRSKIVLQNIRILAVGQRLSSDPNKPEQVPVVTLLVTPEESERLALASTQGKLQLTMRSQMDKEQLETPGVSPPELLAVNRSAPTATAVAALVGRPPAAPIHGATAAPPAAAVATTPPVEVVEVLHGDRVEQRKVAGKGALP